jgi:hypothetical protein
MCLLPRLGFESNLVPLYKDRHNLSAEVLFIQSISKVHPLLSTR